jgi:peroxiredoxin
LETQDTIEVGAEAPEFNLKDQHKTAHNMSDLRGKKVLLSFHPLAWTSICTQQMESLETHMAEFSDLNTVPFGVSIDSSPSKLAWGDSMGIKELKASSATTWVSPTGPTSSSMRRARSSS